MKYKQDYVIKIPVVGYHSGVYAIHCLETDRFYIGSSEDLRKRLVQHNSMLKRNEHHNTGLQQDYNKGYSFVALILSENPNTRQNKLIKIEYDFIKKYHNNNIDLYNFNLYENTLDSLKKYYNNMFI